MTKRDNPPERPDEFEDSKKPRDRIKTQILEYLYTQDSASSSAIIKYIKSISSYSDQTIYKLLRELATTSFVVQPRYGVYSLELKQTKSYKCRKCEHIFDSDDEFPYCPICENEIVTELKGGNLK